MGSTRDSGMTPRLPVLEPGDRTTLWPTMWPIAKGNKQTMVTIRLMRFGKKGKSLISLFYKSPVFIEDQIFSVNFRLVSNFTLGM